MSSLSEKFLEQINRLQQQFDELTPFEQLYTSIELTKKVQLSYRYFLSQLLIYNNNQQENSDMFQHTIHQANTPAILACLLSDPLDKIIRTLHLYLPLVSISATNEKLLESYRDVLKYLDSKLINPLNFSYTEQQLINHCQQIRFFIQTNPSLQKFLIDIPQLNALASSATMINKGNMDEKTLSTSPPSSSSAQKHHQPLQRYPAVRLYQNPSPTTSPPSMNYSTTTTTSQNVSLCQQLLPNDASDSGVDLSEPCIVNSVQNFLSSPNSQHTIIGRSHSANLSLTNGQDNQNNHQFVVKSSSSPTPEQTIPTRSSFVPLSAVLSAPAQSIHSYNNEFRHHNYNYQQQIKPTLTVSDEDEEDSQLQQNYTNNNLTKTIDNFSLDHNSIDNTNRLRHFSSLRNPNPKPNINHSINQNEGVSQYLGIDGYMGSVRNTFIQPNSGMRDVPKWLKNLRLHKYAFFFSQMTYDQMMNLTIEQLKEGKITDGACTKILLNIKKLKERQNLLQQCLNDIDNGQIDIKTVLQQLNEFILTPIRAKQTEQNDDNDEDLPKLIMQVLEKVYQQLTSNNASTNLLSELGNNLVGLFDRCYKHEAFSAEQRHTLLHWRGPLCNKLQTSGKIEFKSMQSSSSLNRRVQLKPQTSMGSMNTTQINKPAVRNIKSTLSYYPNYQISSIPLTRQHNSECSNGNESNLIRRPVKSPTLIFTPNNEPNDESLTTSNNHLSIVSSHSLQEQTSYHQTKPFITERSGNGSGNLRPSFNYIQSTSQRNNNNNNNGTFLAANSHQLLTRKTSIGPYGETNLDDKTKLCKTYSGPSKIRYYNPSPTVNYQSSTTSTQLSPQQTNYQMTSTPYPPRQYLSRSPTSTNTNHLFDNTELINQSPIQKPYSDQDSSVFYENENTNPSSSNTHNHHNPENSYSQRHNSTEFETLCRQMTESAISDDVHDTAIDHKENFSDIQPIKTSSNHSTDTE